VKTTTHRAAVAQTKNGIVLSVDKESTYVWQYRNEDPKADAEAFADALWKIIQDHSPVECGSRYSAARVFVDVRPGDKFPEPETNEKPVDSGGEAQPEAIPFIGLARIRAWIGGQGLHGPPWSEWLALVEYVEAGEAALNGVQSIDKAARFEAARRMVRR